MPNILQRFREIVQSGDTDAFEDALEYLEDQPIPPASQVERIRERREKEEELERLDPTNWPPEMWTCPQCGSENVGSECGYCRREARFQENFGGAE